MQVAKPINPETEDLFPPVNIKRFIKWAIFGLVGFIITSILVSILVVILIIKYLISPAVNSLPDVANQGAELLRNGQTQLEERLKGDEARIQHLEEKVQQLELRGN